MSSLRVRQLAAYSTVSAFLLYFIFSGVGRKAQDSSIFSLVSSGPPEFSRYADSRTLSSEEFPIDDKNRRVILVGDIHGRFPEFQALLKKLSYSPPNDVLVSAGDIVAKGPLEGSLKVLSFMASNNVTAVRGNHDQKVVEWRTWMNWIRSLPGGKRWLRTMRDHYDDASSEGHFDVEAWVDQERNRDRKRSSTNLKWWNKIPASWKFFGPHFLIADGMSEQEYSYMLSLPLIIHVPHAHTYVVHAGILASDPQRKTHDRRQPLAHVPTLPKSELSKSQKDKEEMLRTLQEKAVLQDVPQNNDPWITLNMRSILDDNTVTRSAKEGEPWSDYFVHDMSLCAGFNAGEDHGLPCNPATVIYGHAASRGLDVKRWTIGLDSGCVYDRRLSSLVLGGRYARVSLTDAEFSAEDDELGDPDSAPYDINGKRLRSTIRFGDKGKGKIVTVHCNS